MSELSVLSKSEQQVVPLFDGRFTENKPIPFPDETGSQAYSNLFYWAHLEAHQTGEFPLHPHKGFEIMTFVLKGSLEHYDTASGVWTSLSEGGVQVICAGSGVEHAERIMKGTELFQIWFDPGFSESLKKTASYQDYEKERFEEKMDNQTEIIHYLGQGAPIEHMTGGIDIKKMHFGEGAFDLEMDPDAVYSIYLLDGEVGIDTYHVSKDSFVYFDSRDALHIEVKDHAELFIIQSPLHVTYQRFIDRY